MFAWRRLAKLATVWGPKSAKSMGWSWPSYHWPISPCLQLNPRVSSFASQPLNKMPFLVGQRQFSWLQPHVWWLKRNKTHVWLLKSQCSLFKDVSLCFYPHSWRYIAVSLLVRFMADSSCPRSVATPTSRVKWKKCCVTMRKNNFLVETSVSSVVHD